MAGNKRKKARKSPSKIKYDKANPVTSLRIPESLKDKLREIKEKEGRTVVDVLKAGAGIHEVKIRDEEEVRQEAYDKGWQDGVNQAADVYEVTYRCGNCKKQMSVTSDAEKRAIREFIEGNGWHHSDCNDPNI